MVRFEVAKIGIKKTALKGFGAAFNRLVLFA